MKNKKSFSLVFVIILVCCSKHDYYSIHHSGSEKITDLAVVLSRNEADQYLLDTTTGLPVIVKDMNGTLLPSQCDDMNGDGNWDQLVFLTELDKGDTRKVTFEPVEPEAYPVFAKRTGFRFCRAFQPYENAWGDLRMKTNDTKFTIPVYQMEGPAWENDVVAFRNYYDARNGIDIYGKRVTDMVLDSVGIDGRDYHALADWGMDILKVGNSLGAGALAISYDDSLYRVGPCEEGRFRLISQGPVRTVFELTFKNVPAGNRVYSMTQQISIYAGDPFYWSRVVVNGLQGDEELVTGIVNLHDLPGDYTDVDGWKALSTWGNQAMNGEVLGMAVIFQASDFKRYWEAPGAGNGIVSTHLVSLALYPNKPTEYAFVAAWELQDGQLKDKAYFEALIRKIIHKIQG